MRAYKHAKSTRIECELRKIQIIFFFKEKICFNLMCLHRAPCLYISHTLPYVVLLIAVAAALNAIYLLFYYYFTISK